MPLRCVEIMYGTGSGLVLALLLLANGCGEKGHQGGVAPRAAAPAPGSYFDPFRIQRVTPPADAAREPNRAFPAVLVPAEPTPQGYLAPPPLQMIAATEGPATLAAGPPPRIPPAGAR